jgi:hypothetical protein
MRAIKPTPQGAPFYNAFIRRYPIQAGIGFRVRRRPAVIGANDINDFSVASSIRASNGLSPSRKLYSEWASASQAG